MYQIKEEHYGGKKGDIRPGDLELFTDRIFRCNSKLFLYDRLHFLACWYLPTISASLSSRFSISHLSWVGALAALPTDHFQEIAINFHMFIGYQWQITRVE